MAVSGAASVRISPVPARKRRRVMLELAAMGRFNSIRLQLGLAFTAVVSELGFHDLQTDQVRFRCGKNQKSYPVKPAG
jgi:hypothetical protein